MIVLRKDQFTSLTQIKHNAEKTARLKKEGIEVQRVVDNSTRFNGKLAIDLYGSRL